MFFRLFILFIVIPLFDFYILMTFGDRIGFFNTLALVILTGIAGAHFARKEGMKVLFNLQNKMNEGGLPAGEVIHGVLIFAGGLLLLTPGFITDGLGFMMIFPLTRGIFAAAFSAILADKIKKGSVKFYSANTSQQGGFSSQYSSQQTRTVNPYEDVVTGSSEIKDINPEKK